jgi:hypothetical protein
MSSQGKRKYDTAVVRVTAAPNDVPTREHGAQHGDGRADERGCMMKWRFWSDETAMAYDLASASVACCSLSDRCDVGLRIAAEAYAGLMLEARQIEERHLEQVARQLAADLDEEINSAKDPDEYLGGAS